MNFGRSNFSRKGLSRFENRVEKQMRSEELGESGSMTIQALGRARTLWDEVVEDHWLP